MSRRWPARIPTVDRVERLDDGPLAVGARTRLAQPKLPEAVWTVTELTPGAAFTWTSSSPGVRITASHAGRAHARGLPPHPGGRSRRMAGTRGLVDDQIADPAVRRDRGRLDQGRGRGGLTAAGSRSVRDRTALVSGGWLADCTLCSGKRPPAGPDSTAHRAVSEAGPRACVAEKNARQALASLPDNCLHTSTAHKPRDDDRTGRAHCQGQHLDMKNYGFRGQCRLPARPPAPHYARPCSKGAQR